MTTVRKLLVVVLVLGVGFFLLKRGGEVLGDGPHIQFVGVATGSLSTDVNSLQFSDTFSVKDHDIVGVVSFENVKNGSQVQATWFSPDDRRIPLGRKTITTESGAKIAKFSISNAVDWEPAPYMFDIFIMEGEGESMKTVTDKAHFFIGMEDEAIQAYWEDWNAYQENEEEKKREREQRQKKQEQILRAAAKTLRMKEAVLSLQMDVDGDASPDIIVLDPPLSDDARGFEVRDAEVNQLLILNASGATVLSLLPSDNQKVVSGPSGPLGTPLPTKNNVFATLESDGTLTLEWKDRESECTVSYAVENGAYKEAERLCTGIKF